MDLTSLVPGIFSANSQPGPTPTPQQIQSAYAQANTMKGQGLSTEPVHAWTQGVNQMLKALLGNTQGNRADALQRQAYGAQANAIPQTPAPYMPALPMQAPPPANNAPASTYGAGVPYLFGGGMPGGIGGQ
jgi:hypothetical protein